MGRKRAKESDETVQPKPRSLEARLIPYLIPHCLSLAVLALGLGAHSLWGSRPIATPLASLAMAAGTAGLAVLAHRIGRVREPVIRWHTTITVCLTGAAATITMIIGPSLLWLQIAWGCGLLIAFSWNLRRLDSLRQDTAASPADQDQWAVKLGLGNVKPGRVKELPGRREIVLSHREGDTVKTVQAALPALEAAASVIPGRSRVVADPEDAGQSTLVLVTEDALRDAIPWPGPSAPGGCITEPLVFAVYEDHVMFELQLCGPDVVASHLLWMGMSGAGKTIAALQAVTEILTRRNVIVWWYDASKGEQSVGPIRHAFDHYANTVPAGHQMMKALKEAIVARADAMGKAGFDAWEPACYDHPDLRIPLLFAHFEEAVELVADSKTFTDLTQKARSTGIIISVSLQRATATSMPTDARFNIGTALCFGTGDDYSAGFALSDQTIDAGAHPENWGNRKPGYFYAEAPSIDETRFPVPLRSCWPDKKALVEIVDAHASQRAKRDPVTAAVCARILSNTPVASTNVIDVEVEEEDVEDPIPAQPDAELITTMDGSQSIPPHEGPELAFGTPKPKADSPAAAAAEFDRVLAEIVGEGQTEFQVKDMVERLKIRSDTWVSRRLSAVANGTATVPPGISLKRGDNPGQYKICVLAGASS